MLCDNHNDKQSKQLSAPAVRMVNYNFLLWLRTRELSLIIMRCLLLLAKLFSYCFYINSQSTLLLLLDERNCSWNFSFLLLKCRKVYDYSLLSLHAAVAALKLGHNNNTAVEAATVEANKHLNIVITVIYLHIQHTQRKPKAAAFLMAIKALLIHLI